MAVLKTLLFKVAPWLLGVYLLAMIVLYFKQTSFLFHPKRSPNHIRYDFHNNYEEIYVPTAHGEDSLHTVLFKTNRHSKGVIFFLHGNMRSMERWGKLSEVFNPMGYDFWVVDYRGYGKSEGKLSGEEQLHDDMERVFHVVRERYGDKITLMGFSIGTGPTARLGSEYDIQQMILMAPYFSVRQLVQERVPLAPAFLVKFPLKTYEWLPKVKAPILIIHGDKDKVIPFRHGVELSRLLKPGDRFIRIPGQGHHEMLKNKKVVEAIRDFLDVQPINDLNHT